MGLCDALLTEIGADTTTAINNERKVAVKEGKEHYLACLFLSGVGGTRCKHLKSHLANKHLLGKDSYLKSYDTVMKLLDNFKEGHSTGMVVRVTNQEWHYPKESNSCASRKATTTSKGNTIT